MHMNREHVSFLELKDEVRTTLGGAPYCINCLPYSVSLTRSMQMMRGVDILECGTFSGVD